MESLDDGWCYQNTKWYQNDNLSSKSSRASQFLGICFISGAFFQGTFNIMFHRISVNFHREKTHEETTTSNKLLLGGWANPILKIIYIIKFDIFPNN